MGRRSTGPVVAALTGAVWLCLAGCGDDSAERADDGGARLLDGDAGARDDAATQSPDGPGGEAGIECSSDVDADGTPDCRDECLLDPLKVVAGPCGCQEASAAPDGGILCSDRCPEDPTKSEPGLCGCGFRDTDTDGDGFANCGDRCPTSPDKADPGVCGCFASDADSDGDGTVDCQDGCGLDPESVEPGPCGCGVSECSLPELDSDGDGVADHLDGCPLDASKAEPGGCGCSNAPVPAGTECVGACEAAKHCDGHGQCGVVDELYCRDFELDSDGDGTPDTQDQCPEDAERLVPGDCGCADDPAPAGTVCDDGLCASAIACDGAGMCGSAAACAPDQGCAHAFHDGKLYWICDHARSWTEANARCRLDTDRQLLQIDDRAENAWVSEAVAAMELWIGGNDLAQGGSWRWSTPQLNDGPLFWSGDAAGSAPADVYTAWAPGHPQQVAGRALLLRGTDSAWITRPVDDNAGYLCSKPFDTCPLDPAKIGGGVCGCAVPDIDSDLDGTLDCDDSCPDDPERVEPADGACARVTLISSDASRSEASATGARSAVDGRGMQLFVWQTDVGDHAEIHARRINERGASLELRARPIVLATGIPLGFRAEPTVAGLSQGGWAVAWSDAFADGDRAGIVYTVLARNGTHRAARVANDGIGLDQSSPRIAAFGSGFALAWIDAGRALRTSVVLRTFDASGTAMMPDFVVAAGDTADQLQPVIAAAGARLLVLWTDTGTPAIRARELDSTSSTVVAHAAHSPAVVSDGHEGFLASWVTAAGSKTSAVFAATWTATDEPGTTPAVRVGDVGEPRREGYPTVARFSASAYVIAWSYEDGDLASDFAIVGALGPAEVELRELLRTSSGQLQVQAADQGAWLSWVDSGFATGGSVARAITAALLAGD